MKKWLVSVVVLVFCGCFLLQAQVDSPLKKAGDLEKAGKLDEAANAYQEAIKATPTEEAYRKLGALLGKQQKYDQAETLLGEGLQKFSESTSLMNLSGFIQFKKGNKAEAENHWKKVLAKDPKNSFANEWIEKLGSTQTPSVASTEPAKTGTGSETPSKGSALFTQSNSLPLPEQEKLARQVYEEMSQMDKQDFDSIAAAHKKVIEKCPQTKRAEESLWKLHNLYSQVMSEPDYPKDALILEFLMATYPESEMIPAAKNHLLYTYEKLQAWDKLVPLYADLMQRKEGFTEGELRSTTMGYADALAGAGKKAEAKALYEEIIQKWGGDEESMEAALAGERLKNL